MNGYQDNHFAGNSLRALPLRLIMWWRRRREEEAEALEDMPTGRFRDVLDDLLGYVPAGLRGDVSDGLFRDVLDIVPIAAGHRESDRAA